MSADLIVPRRVNGHRSVTERLSDRVQELTDAVNQLLNNDQVSQAKITALEQAVAELQAEQPQGLDSL